MEKSQVIGLAGLTTFSLLCMIIIKAPLLMILLCLLGGFISANFMEYSIHRWFLHQKPKWFPAAYREHAGVHHRMYLEENMESPSLEKENILTPFLSVVSVLSIGFLVSSLVALFLGLKIGVLWYAAMVLYYVIYELAHYSTHLEETSLLRRLFPDYIYKHHKLHHNPRRMRKWNFNVLFPLFDILFNTKDPLS
jgi:hypothetical protein